jgi:molybdopterin converting factor subunit 1
MRVHVRCFASVREIVGGADLHVELPDGGTLAELFDQIRRQFPRLDGLAGALLFSVNHEYAPPDRRLSPGDEVALIPPVSGGLHV